MTEIVNLHNEFDRRTLFARLILEHADKKALVELTKGEGYDISAIEVDVRLNDVLISHINLQAFLASAVERYTEHACEKIGYHPFKAQADAKAAEILGKKAVIDNMAGMVSSRIQELMSNLSSLERESGYFCEKLYDEVESKMVLRDIRVRLRQGNLSDDDRTALLDQLDAMDLN